MNWDAVGSIGEVLGAGAVVVTLIFLIVEMRESRKIAQAASVDSLADGWNKLNTVVMADSELTSLWFNGLNDPSALNEVQRNRFLMVSQSYVNHFMTVKKHYEAGHLPEEEWRYHSMGIAHILNSPGGKMAMKIIAITPSIREILEGYQNVDHDDGYLGIFNEKNSSDDRN